MSADADDVTILLKAVREGDAGAADRLAPLVYGELHRLAARYMRRERQDHTLQPTALINEAMLRLMRDQPDWNDRKHFIAVAAQVMRRILVDHARAHNADARGGGQAKVELQDQIAYSPEKSSALLALDEALDRLEQIEPRQAKVVSLRFFGGLSVEEIASVLDVSPRTVKRDWSLARIWLHQQISTTESP